MPRESAGVGCLGMSDRIRLLTDEIQKSRAVADRIAGRIRELRTTEPTRRGHDPVLAIAAAKLLENYYTCLETMFLRISQFFENSLSASHWHAELLEKMTLSVTGRRAAVICVETRLLLDELRRFRHFARYYFDIDYDWAKIEFLFGVLDRVVPALAEDLNEFLIFLSRLDEPNTNNDSPSVPG